MAEVEPVKKRIQVPLLKQYLHEQPGNPPHVPGWIVPMGWAVALGLGMVFQAIADAGCMGFLAAGAIGYLMVMLFNHRFRAKNDHERADEVRYGALRKFKSLASEGHLEGHVPPRVLLALEEAVATFNATAARLSLEDPAHAMERTEAARQSLQACFVAAGMVVRGESQSKRDWKAVLGNGRLIGEVVDTIDAHAARIRDPLALDTERLAALRELEMLEQERLSIQE